MQFTLHYRGPLASNGSPKQKHSLRENFHRQFIQLWQQEPLKGLAEFRANTVPPLAPNAFGIPVGGFDFLPLVSSRASAIAELEIVLLRPEPPGRLITQGGDIDNRLKTLFDSLTIPQANALPKGAQPTPDQIPYFYCLLHEDNLITSVSVKAAQLLEPVNNSSEVDLFINVTTRLVVMGVANTHLA
jgi:hypothetical protein